VLVVVLGIPYQRDVLATWWLFGLLCFSLSDLRGYARGVKFEWLPFIAILIAYDSLRGSAAHLFRRPLSAAAAVRQSGVRRHRIDGVALQHWLWHGHVAWYDVIA
jgi:hypothetical protein